jgi:hypothetical protein
MIMKVLKIEKLVDFIRKYISLLIFVDGFSTLVRVMGLYGTAVVLNDRFPAILVGIITRCAVPERSKSARLNEFALRQLDFAHNVSLH